MKLTPLPPRIPEARPADHTPTHRRFKRLAAAAISCLVAVSCQPAATPPPQPQPPTPRYQPGHWTRVSEKPPIFYPRGASRDTPTGWDGGEWFRLRDAADTRYFIPFNLPAGTSRPGLVGEVESLRTEDYRRQLAKEDAAETAEQLKRTASHAAVLVPLNTVLLMVSCLGGGPMFVSNEDFEQWRRDWREKYGNR